MAGAGNLLFGWCCDLTIQIKIYSHTVPGHALCTSYCTTAYVAIDDCHHCRFYSHLNQCIDINLLLYISNDSRIRLICCPSLRHSTSRMFGVSAAEYCIGHCVAHNYFSCRRCWESTPPASTSCREGCFSISICVFYFILNWFALFINKTIYCIQNMCRGMSFVSINRHVLGKVGYCHS